MRTRAWAMIVLLALPRSATGQQPAGAPSGLVPLRVETYDLDVSFDRDPPRISGMATVTFRDLPSGSGPLIFYLHDELQVDSILVSGRALRFSSDTTEYFYSYTTRALRTKVAVDYAALSTGITVFYHGVMSPSTARAASDYMRVDNDGVFLRAYGYSLWFPTFLEPGQSSPAVTFRRVILRTPAGFRSVFVGSRVRETDSGSQVVSEWSADDVDLLLVQWTAQRFEVAEAGSVHAYHYADAASTAATRGIVDFASEITDRYRRYYRADAQVRDQYLVEMPPFGMISSRNVSALPESDWDNFGADDASRIDLAHELVHPFVQFPATPFSNPMWALLIEGFPSYFHYPVLDDVLGHDFYIRRMARIQAAYLKRREAGTTQDGQPLPPEKPILDIAPSDLPIYKDVFVLNDRVTLFLNWLRTRMGAEGFYAFTSDLFARTQLTEEEFQEVIAAHLPGVSDDVRTWLHTTDFPERFHLEAAPATPRHPGRDRVRVMQPKGVLPAAEPQRSLRHACAGSRGVHRRLAVS
jgi:hypothetical protein